MRLLPCLLLLALLLPVPDSGAAQPDSWVGKTVVMKRIKTPIGSADNVVAVLDDSHYKVMAEQNDSIEIKTRHGRGLWFDKSAAVPLPDAVDYFTQQLQADAKDAAALQGRATAWLLKGNLNMAMKDLNDAILNDPSGAVFFNTRGLVWLARKNYPKAIDDFSEAIRLQPQYAVAFANRGNAWFEKRDFIQANADYSEAIRLDKNYSMAFVHRGNARRALKNYNGAQADFAEALRIDPKDVNAYLARGHLWLEKKEYDKVHADYKEANRCDPDFLPALNSFAWLLATCPKDRYRDGRLAVTLARKACEMTAWRNMNYIETLAAAQAEVKNFKEAVRLEEVALGDVTFSRQSGKMAEFRLALYRDRRPFRLGMNEKPPGK